MEFDEGEVVERCVTPYLDEWFLGRCFCGAIIPGISTKRSDVRESLRFHMDANGGLAKHLADYCYGEVADGVR